MWIFTKRGFLSAVQHRTRKNLLIVRARCEEDIKALQKELYVSTGRTYRYLTTDNSDYRYRIEVSKGDFSGIVAKWARDIDYENFKAEVKGDPARDYAYGSCWIAMSQFQEEEKDDTLLRLLRREKAGGARGGKKQRSRSSLFHDLPSRGNECV